MRSFTAARSSNWKTPVYLLPCGDGARVPPALHFKAAMLDLWSAGLDAW